MQPPFSRIPVGKLLYSREQKLRIVKSVCDHDSQGWSHSLWKVWFHCGNSWGRQKVAAIVQRRSQMPEWTFKSNSIDCLGAWTKMRWGNVWCDLVLLVSLVCLSKPLPNPLHVFAVQVSIDWFPKIKKKTQLGYIRIKHLVLSAYLRNCIQLGTRMAVSIHLGCSACRFTMCEVNISVHEILAHKRCHTESGFSEGVKESPGLLYVV